MSNKVVIDKEHYIIILGCLLPEKKYFVAPLARAFNLATPDLLDDLLPVILNYGIRCDPALGLSAF